MAEYKMKKMNAATTDNALSRNNLSAKYFIGVWCEILIIRLPSNHKQGRQKSPQTEDNSMSKYIYQPTKDAEPG